MNTEQKIYAIIEDHDGISSSEIANIIGYSSVTVHKNTVKLLGKWLIIKTGNARSTRYFGNGNMVNDLESLTDILGIVQKSLSEIHEQADTIDIHVLVQSLFLEISPEGDEIIGYPAFFRVITRENNNREPSKEHVIERLTNILVSYLDEEMKRRKNGFFDGTASLKNTLQTYGQTCHVDHLYFAELSALSHYGKLRTGVEMYYGKLLQNRELLVRAVKPCMSNIEDYCIEKQVDAIILTPPTLPRKVQFQDVFFEQFWIDIFPITAKKVDSKLFRPQKELKGMDRFVNAHVSIEIKIPNRIENFAHILIIDDNFTTGATVNAIAEKLRNAGYNGKITVITVTGNFAYIPGITDNEEI